MINEQNFRKQREEDRKARGLDAITRQVHGLYKDQEGKHYVTQRPYMLGGDDPLDQVSIYVSEEGEPHWHYITYGFTELYDKETADEKVSGYGFELTFRLKKNEEEAPLWPIDLLQSVAGYVFKSGNVLSPGHHINVNGPLEIGRDTDLTALLFIEDPELKAMDTPNGHVDFIQMIGITQDELDAVMCWSGQSFAKFMERYIPYGISDLDRENLMEDPEIVAAVEVGIEQEGSSTGYLYTDCLHYSQMSDGWHIELEAKQIINIMRMLKGCTSHQNPFSLIKEDTIVTFQYGPSRHIEVSEGEELIFTLNDQTLEEMKQSLHPKAGSYSLRTMPLTFDVQETNGK